MSDELSVAVVGATGAVGEAMIEILEQRSFPVKELVLLASERSEGKRLQFKGSSIKVGRLDDFDFSDTDIALFSAGASISEKFAPIAAEAGCYVIDNTSRFRYDSDIPLVVPEINGALVKEQNDRRIIANPNCSTIQMVVALKPIYDAVGIRRINVASYQSVSGAGASGVRELAGQTADLLNGNSPTINVMPKQIAFNAIPAIDDFQDNGYTKEEMKLVWETKKIFDNDRIEVNPTCVRIPVFYGHSEAVHVETDTKITADEVRVLMREFDGITLVDDPASNGYPTAVAHAAGSDAVYVGRIREDISHPLGLDLWVVSDNVRKGAALNSVQIAELLIDRLSSGGG